MRVWIVLLVASVVFATEDFSRSVLKIRETKRFNTSQCQMLTFNVHIPLSSPS